MRQIILAFFCLFSTLAFASDRVAVQVQFKKGIFECPGGDEIVDWNIGGGNAYEHTCKDGTWLNQFKEYNGVLKIDPQEYERTDSVEMKALKDAEVSKWLNDVRNQPPYVEPSVSDYQQMIDERLSDIKRLSDDVNRVGSLAQFVSVQGRLNDVAVELNKKKTERVKAQK